MNIFEIEYNEGEYEWVLANDRQEAKDLSNFCESSDLIRILSEKEEKESYIIDPNEYLDDVPDEVEDDYLNGYKIIMNMNEFKNQNNIAQLIASSEF